MSTCSENDVLMRCAGNSTRFALLLPQLTKLARSACSQRMAEENRTDVVAESVMRSSRRNVILSVTAAAQVADGVFACVASRRMAKIGLQAVRNEG